MPDPAVGASGRVLSNRAILIATVLLMALVTVLVWWLLLAYGDGKHHGEDLRDLHPSSPCTLRQRRPERFLKGCPQLPVLSRTASLRGKNYEKCMTPTAVNMRAALRRMPGQCDLTKIATARTTPTDADTDRSVL
jgi:hypothetical protein